MVFEMYNCLKIICYYRKLFIHFHCIHSANSQIHFNNIRQLFYQIVFKYIHVDVCGVGGRTPINYFEIYYLFVTAITSPIKVQSSLLVFEANLGCRLLLRIKDFFY